MIILDLQMPGKDGIEVLQFLTHKGFDGKVHLTSGMDRKVIDSAAKLAHSLGLDIAGILQKPITLQVLEEGLSQSFKADSFVINKQTISQAIENDDLVLYHQPKIMFGEDGGVSVHSCEALVRWLHKDQGLIPPVQFIPLAEREGLMGPLTDAVLAMAMQQVKDWQDMGIDMKLAINVPPHLLSDNGFPHHFSEMANRIGVSASSFIIEVTERTLFDDAVGAMETLTRLRIMGAGLAIDDFGTGHSSLIQLHQMPFNEIKIDKSFIDDMKSSDDARTIVRAIINLAHDLSMKVCAEGVETRETLDMLRDMGCDFIQGYYFDPPLDPARATQLLRSGPAYSMAAE